jgi:hypothetical protein
MVEILGAELIFSLSCDFLGGPIIRRDLEKFRPAGKIPPCGPVLMYIISQA